MEAAHEAGALSLYFDLKPGEKADLEVVAAAAIKWVEALRAAAREIDPDTNIKVELLDAEEGSLRLNTILEWMESQVARIQDGSGKYPRLKKMAIAAAVFVPLTGYPTYDFYFGDHAVELSQEDRQRLDDFIAITKGKPSIERPAQEFFRALEQDPSIKGVGVTESKDERPRTIIPSSEFPERSGLWSTPQVDIVDQKRTSYPIVDVTLISPVLVRKKLAWKFQPDGGMPAFTAKMSDERFLEALDEKHVKESLSTGIRMKLRLKVEEVNSGGVWEPKKRTVVEVISPRAN